MESECAAFGRVVENARTGLTLKGEARRRRANIGVRVWVRPRGSDTDQSEQGRALVASSDFIRILFVVGDGEGDVEVASRREEAGK